jgi:hypothetical protein
MKIYISKQIMKKILLLIMLFFLFSYKSIGQTNRELYKESIVNSIYPDSSKIYSGLVSINKDNKNLIRRITNGEEYILVCTWKQNISFYSKDTVFNTGNYPLWVTTAPELKNRFCSESVKDTNLRLLQLLGLPPEARYSYFVEIWVRPQDLFRPCPDKEIWDSKCDLCFPSGTDEEHIRWINENRISRYYQCNLYDQYPWGQLGYTYDWNPNNKSHVGLSEFIIGANKTVYINKIVTTSNYLK